MFNFNVLLYKWHQFKRWLWNEYPQDTGTTKADMLRRLEQYQSEGAQIAKNIGPDVRNMADLYRKRG